MSRKRCSIQKPCLDCIEIQWERYSLIELKALRKRLNKSIKLLTKVV